MFAGGDEKCVVSYVEVANAKEKKWLPQREMRSQAEQQLLQREQMQQQQQLECTWMQYLLLDYFANNKCDIIDYQQKCVNHQLVRNGQDTTNDKNNNNINKSIINCQTTNIEQPIYLITKSNHFLTPDQTTTLESHIKITKRNQSLAVDLIEGGGEEEYHQSTIIKKRQFENNKLKHLPVLIFLFVALLSNQNAQLCSGFSYPMQFDNSDFIGYNYPFQTTARQSSLNPVSFLWNQQPPNHRHRNSMRQLTPIDPMNTLPTSLIDSFTNQGGLQPPSSPPAPSSSPSMMNSNGGEETQDDTLDDHIKHILVPRVSGTQGNIDVRNYIVDNFKSNGYNVELDEFTDSTPIGKVKFANIIATSNPNACRQLVLACHYDSKMMDGFLGAIDSAVPCAMLLKMSETFSKSFRSTGGDPKKDLGLMFIFFDGEEAYNNWSATDSLYGSRHLAEKWQKTPMTQCPGRNRLSSLELFVLLDLIGSADTYFVMYNTQLRHHYNSLQKYERAHLSKLGLTGFQLRNEIAFTNDYRPLNFVEDDHVPFKKRGVPILSLLAHPFPKVWHTIADNYTAINFPRTRRILSVLEEFVSNYR